jgi:RNA polymerase sigma-70 factor (ECF subfamily)
MIEVAPKTVLPQLSRLPECRRSTLPAAYEESRLVRRCQEHDSRAWKEFLAHYRSRIQRYTYSILRNTQDAEDATALTISRVYQNIHTFRRDSRLLPWLYRIARNVAITMLQRDRHPTVSLSLVGSVEVGEGGEWQIKDSSPLPEDEVIYSQERDRIVGAIQYLPRYQREMLEMYHAEGRSYKEIARKTGVPLGTVKSRMARARVMLRERLDM